METVEHHGRVTAYRSVDPHEEDDRADRGLLYVHGSGGAQRLWAAQYGPGGPAHPAAALDLAGHGQSEDVDAAPGDETLEAYAKDVIAVARETDAGVLVGSSLGGAIALRIALGDELDLDALVLAGTGAKLTVGERLRELLGTDFEGAVEFLHGPDRLFHDPDEDAIERSAAEMRATGQRVTRRDFLTCHRFDVRDRLDEIGVPALAVVGEHDSLTPPAFHEYLADRIPGCEYTEISGAAHLAMVERSAEFNEAVADFLDQRV